MYLWVQKLNKEHFALDIHIISPQYFTSLHRRCAIEPERDVRDVIYIHLHISVEQP